jgi:capsular polysaccharide biosynthesis protein
VRPVDRHIGDGEERQLMELSEAFVRVIGRHIAMIAVLVACGLLGAGLLIGGSSTQYRATVRLAMDTGDPATQAQSTVIADTARALATSPSLVAGSLHTIGASRDAVNVAQHDVTVASLGSSGVVALSVLDQDNQVAVSLAKQIAADVIAAHDQVVNGLYESTVHTLDASIAQARRDIASLDDHIKGVGPLYDVAKPTGGVPLSERPWAEPNQLLRQRADLVQRLGSLNSEHATLEADHSLHAAGAIVDNATPADRVAGRLVSDIALGGLLGLLAGIALASLLETFRPTLVGRDALARNLGAPVLAEVRGVSSADADLAEAAMHIELAAVAARVDRVGLLSMRRQLDVGPMTDLLAQSVRGLDIDVITRHTSGPVPHQNDGVDDTGNGAHSRGGPRGTTGVVLVTPKVVRVSELSRIVEFFTISGWPLLGLIVVPARRSPFGLRIIWQAPTPDVSRLRPQPPQPTDGTKGDQAWTSRS